jgi:hypothetical protein
VLYPDAFGNVALWWDGVALLLIFDVGSGCVANFSHSANAFYAKRPRRRWGMIVIHFHVFALAILFGMGVAASVAVNAYTICAAALVNALAGSHLQGFDAGVLVAIGFLWIVTRSGLPPVLMIVNLLFVFKLVLAFAVDHFPAETST